MSDETISHPPAAAAAAVIAYDHRCSGGAGEIMGALERVLICRDQQCDAERDAQVGLKRDGCGLRAPLQPSRHAGIPSAAAAAS